MNCLQHHGIKGQKWGVRRYQNEDGTLTESGKKHYSIVSDRRSHRENLKNAYIRNGFTDKEADEIAKGRVTTEKILIGIGAAALIGVAAYGATKYARNNFDSVVKAGTTLSRVASNGAQSVKDGFYATHDKGDAEKYLGLFGKQKELHGDKVFSKSIEATKNVKVAGNNTGVKNFKKLYNTDSDFKKLIDTYYQDHINGGNEANGNIRKMYENFNRTAPLLKPGMSNDPSVTKSIDAWNKFTGELGKQGYGGIKDVNDRKFSGYNSKKANIYFKAKDFAVKSVREVSSNEIQEKYVKSHLKLAMGESVKKLSPYAAIGAGASAAIGLGKIKSDKDYINSTVKE